MKRIGLVAIALIISSFGIVGCSNPDTPAGYVGYIRQGSIVGRARFYGTQTGPTSTGLGWLLSAINVQVTPLTLDEGFGGDSAVLSKDNLQVSFAVHTVLRVRPDGVQDLVDHFSSANAGDPPRAAYDMYFKAPLRTFARDEIQRFTSFEIKDNI